MKTSDSSASWYCGSPLSVLRVICGDERPAEAERAVAGAGVVGQRELRAEAGAAGARGDRHRHRAGAGDRVGGELLADAADGAAAFGESYGRCGRRAIAVSGFFATALHCFRIEHQRVTCSLCLVLMLGQLIFSPVLRDRLRFDVPSTRRHVFSVEGASGARPRSRPFRLKLVSCLTAGSLPHLQTLCVLLEYQFGPRARQTFPNGTFPRLKTAVSRLNGRLSGQCVRTLHG